MTTTNGTHLNVNSYISLGMLGSLIVGFLSLFFWLNNHFDSFKTSQADLKAEVTKAQDKMSYDMKEVVSRVTNIETNRSTDKWTGTDMFKWAVHLQRDNPSLHVPEPKHEAE